MSNEVIAVLGAGSWGTALANVAAERMDMLFVFGHISPLKWQKSMNNTEIVSTLAITLCMKESLPRPI